MRGPEQSGAVIGTLSHPIGQWGRILPTPAYRGEGTKFYVVRGVTAGVISHADFRLL